MNPSLRPPGLLGRTAVLAAAAALALLACSDVLEEQKVAPVTSVRIAPDSIDLPIGRTARLEAFPIDSTGAFRPLDSVVWVSSDPQVAAVDDTGAVRGLKTGTVNIVAFARGVEGAARVRVGTAPEIEFATDSIGFTAAAGQGSPPPQGVTVRNAGGLPLSGLTVGAIEYGTGPTAWLVAALDTSAAPATLTLQAATGPITQAGTYTASVPIVAQGAGNSPRVLRVFLSVVPGPPATYRMTIAAGNNQLAPAGTAVPIRPAITITDSFQNPITGIPVTFLVVAGGGEVTGAVVNTDVAGLAEVGSWTVAATGSVPADGRYVNQLQASAPDAGAVTFGAQAYFTYVGNVHPLWALHGCAGCHGGANLGQLRLNGAPAATWAGELFDVPTLCAAGALRQVAPGGGVGAETASLLIAKLDNTAPAACPTPMPTNGVLIPAAARDTIRAWIRAGAPLDRLP